MADKPKTQSQPDIQTIRAAITKHRGGYEKATDAQIRAAWRSLPVYLQQRYLKGDTPPPENNDPAGK